MFLRLLTRGLWQRRSRAALALAALTLAATMITALLNLYVDAQRKIESEFKLYGANVMISPGRSAGAAGAPELLSAELAGRVLGQFYPDRLESVVPSLLTVVELDGQSVVLNGTWLDQFAQLGGFELLSGRPPESSNEPVCWLGRNVAERFGLAVGDAVRLAYRDSVHTCAVAGVLESGQAEDNQIIAPLGAVEELAGVPGRLNVILARASGDAAVVEGTVAELAAAAPLASVNALRQVTESEFRVVGRIRQAAAGTTLVVLAITALCVWTTMTSLAFERRQTIGTLKALGASNARIGLIFLAEAVVLALLASLIGFAAGQGLAVWLGGTLFSAGVTVRWVTLPWAAAVTAGIAVLGVIFPLRLTQRIQPAVMLRGE